MSSSLTQMVSVHWTTILSLYEDAAQYARSQQEFFNFLAHDFLHGIITIRGNWSPPLDATIPQSRNMFFVYRFMGEFLGSDLILDWHQLGNLSTHNQGRNNIVMDEGTPVSVNLVNNRLDIYPEKHQDYTYQRLRETVIWVLNNRPRR